MASCTNAMMRWPRALSPFTLAGVPMRNRIFLPAHTTNFARDFLPTPLRQPLAGRLEASDDAILGAWQDQLARLRRAPWPTVIVGNEVGWSPVPAEPVLRRFRDLAGWTAQAAAEASDEAWLLVAGCPLRLK